MFITGIAVKGYQSLYDVKLSLGNFTVIYGESDVGKSALYRAVMGVVNSEMGDGFISKGCGAAVVGLQLASGPKLAWIKKKGKSGEYTAKMDAETPLVVWKRNRRLPPDLAKLLMFGEISVDGEKILPNFRSQFDSLFLLFESGGKRARVLGSLISNVLLRAVKQANLERVRSDADVRSLSDLIEDMVHRESFDWDDYLINVEIEKKVLAKLSQAEGLLETLGVLVDKQEKLEAVLKVVVDYLPPSVFTELDTLVEAHTKLEALVTQKEWCAKEATKLKFSLEAAYKDLEKADMDIVAIEEKLTFNCPHCGKSISKLEVDYE